MDAAVILAQSVDKSQMPPLHQKRILAFVNHFLIQSCTFLNEFGTKCENKFVELERKMQKVEAALTIIEAKLASIPDAKTTSSIVPETSNENRKKFEDNSELVMGNKQQVIVERTSNSPAEVKQEAREGVRACSDVRYKKFFQMVLFGVPAEAVKLKMQAEGVDARILDTTNLSRTDLVHLPPKI